jgi:hypothetical protein
MPTTLVTIPQGGLGANAAFNSVPSPGPIAVPADCASLVCTLTVSAADQQDATRSITWGVYCAPPGPAPAAAPPSAGWAEISQESWQGGTFVGKDGQTHASDVSFEESVPARFQGGWVAAAGQNTGAAFTGQHKVGCTVVSNP